MLLLQKEAVSRGIVLRYDEYRERKGDHFLHKIPFILYERTGEDIWETGEDVWEKERKTVQM